MYVSINAPFSNKYARSTFPITSVDVSRCIIGKSGFWPYTPLNKNAAILPGDCIITSKEYKFIGSGYKIKNNKKISYRQNFSVSFEGTALWPVYNISKKLKAVKGELKEG